MMPMSNWPVAGLRPCPFCGEATDLRLHKYKRTDDSFGYVMCGACEQSGDLESWNRRPIEDALVSALGAMLTHMGMDEDEWNKPTFDQARAAIKLSKEGRHD